MAVCPTCKTDYGSNVRICPKDGTPLAVAPAADPNIGVLLEGKYRIDGFISAGGMGSVYRGTHVMLDKAVAIKLIKKGLVTSPDIAARFQREARAASNLGHPNIAAVSDFGQTAEGTLYLVMEYVNGPSLHSVIRKGGPMEAQRVVSIIQPIASALAKAHRLHVVHRDLKPHNIMLAVEADGTETPKLLDFGIAKTFDDNAEQLTMAGFALGTPQYMSPEQAAGRAVDGRSDIYSLGVVLYEMLLGEVPFGDTSLASVLMKQMSEVPVAPSKRRPELHISLALEAIAMRSLEKEPAGRFQSAEELHAALDTVRLALASGVREQADEPDDASQFDATFVLPRSAASLGLPPQPSRVPSAAPSSAASPADRPVPVPSPSAASTAVQPETPVEASAPVPSATGATRPTLVAPGAPPLAAPVVTPAAKSRVAAWVPVAAAAALVVLAMALWSLRGKGSDPDGPATVPPSTPASAQSTPGASPVSPAGGGPGVVAPATPAAAPVAPGPNRVPQAAPAQGTAQSPAAPATGGRPQAPTSQSAAEPAARPEPPPAAPAVAENPSVFVQCSGPSEVCGPMRNAFSDALTQGRMTLATSASRSDIALTVNVEVVEERSSQSFGTTFVTRTYSADVTGDAKGAAVPMPSGLTFSFDARVGRERANENARLLAADTVDRIRAFWQRGR